MLYNHDLMTKKCQMSGCGGICYPISLGEGVALKCSKCRQKSKGGRRGIWAKMKTGCVRSVLTVFYISTGMSYSYARRHNGLRLNKNTWTDYTKLIGLIAGEHNHSECTDPNNKWNYAQFDETAFGKR